MTMESKNKSSVTQLQRPEKTRPERLDIIEKLIGKVSSGESVFQVKSSKINPCCQVSYRSVQSCLNELKLCVIKL